MRERTSYLIVAVLLMAPVLAVVAQEDDDQGQSGEQITLVYEREMFSYRGADRRDPFRPLTDDDMGPRFRELALQGIIHGAAPGESVALLKGGDDRVFRVRVGDVLGNSRVIEIGPTRVVMAVENFGTIRQEILEMPQRGGADR